MMDSFVAFHHLFDILSRGQIVDGLVADFMKANPDIDVKAIYAGNYNDARVKALAALKAGQPAQLSVMFSIDIYELIEQDAIVAFDDIVSTAEEKAWLNSFYPTLMENGRTAGKTWGIPFQRSTIVMYYNKDAFRAAGLDPESPPATWAELVDAVGSHRERVTVLAMVLAASSAAVAGSLARLVHRPRAVNAHRIAT